MGLISWLSGAGTADKTLDLANKAADGIINGFDKIAYTEEEKAENAMKRIEIGVKFADLHLKLVEATANESTTRSITRRIVAIFIMIMACLMIAAIAISYKYDKEYAEFLILLSDKFWLGASFFSVVVFFFGNHVIGGMITKIKK